MKPSRSVFNPFGEGIANNIADEFVKAMKGE